MYHSQVKFSPVKIFSKYEYCLGSPVDIPNSQAPIEGREVYWNLDTPESKATRERFRAEYEAMADTPQEAEMAVTPRMRLVARKRRPTVEPSPSTVAKGDALLQDLMDLAHDVNTRQQKSSEKTTEHGDSRIVQAELGASDKIANVDPFMDDDDDDDMFKDEFGSDDDSLLLQATQAVDVVTKIESKETKFCQPVRNVAPSVTSVVHPRLQVCQEEEFTTNDSFDDFLSQMEMPTVPADTQTSTIPVSQASTCPADGAAGPAPAPALGGKVPVSSGVAMSKSSVTSAAGKQTHFPVPVNPRVAQCKIDGFDSEVDDSFDDILSQIEMPTSDSVISKTNAANDKASSPELKKPRMTFQFKQSNVKYESNTSVAAQNKSVKGGGSFRKFNTFDSPPREKKLIAKFRSDSHIAIPNKATCSKDEIDRKRREALERRKLSQSQKRKL